MDWIGTVSRDPAWLPHAYDAGGDALAFVHAPRETQRRVTFLDPRFLASAPTSPPLPVSALPGGAIRAAGRPMHFIFHTAFCCSTLLARALDIPGAAMALKEPSVLAFFARAWSSGTSAPPRTSLGLTLDLLSRPLALGETQIVKPSNFANSLASEMLALRPDSKALVLSSSLKRFLCSGGLQGADGRAFACDMVRQFARSMPLANAPMPDELDRLSNPQIAAQAWLMQARYLATLAARLGHARVRTLDCDTLIAGKARVLSRLGAFFGLDVDDAQWDAIASGPVFGEHSKALGGQRFSAEAREAQLARVRSDHGPEIAAALDWAKALAARAGAPLALGDTLLA